MNVPLLIAGVATVGLSLTVITKISYDYGAAEQVAAQEAQNREVYAEIKERMDENDIDPGDRAAVRKRLCELAGYKPDDPKCSGVRRDESNSPKAREGAD